MLIHRGFEDWNIKYRTVCSIGNYDGVHIGHQTILKRTGEAARHDSIESVAVTFDPIPKKVLYPQTAPELIQTLEQRLTKIEACGVGHVVVVAFDRAFAEKPPEQFVRECLVDRLRIKGLVVGKNFSFGHEKKGNIDLLKRMGMENDFFVEPVNEITVDGSRVSSTRIRAMIRAGDMEIASRCLGEPYELIGTVIEGKKIGKTLGIPTANINPDNELIPGRGVYVSKAVVRGHSYESATNVGFRPTFGGKQLVVEAHLFEFTDDLYGQKLQLQFLRKLRDEKTFGTPEELKSQILADIHHAREYFTRN